MQEIKRDGFIYVATIASELKRFRKCLGEMELPCGADRASAAILATKRWLNSQRRRGRAGSRLSSVSDANAARRHQTGALNRFLKKRHFVRNNPWKADFVNDLWPISVYQAAQSVQWLTAEAGAVSVNF